LGHREWHAGGGEGLSFIGSANERIHEIGGARLRAGSGIENKTGKQKLQSGSGEAAIGIHGRTSSQ
jgi:hypothetical protein